MPVCDVRHRCAIYITVHLEDYTRESANENNQHQVMALCP